jgi:resuscitation-promoting factor RpfB
MGVSAAALVALVLGGCGVSTGGTTAAAAADAPTATQQQTDVDATESAGPTPTEASPAASAEPQVTTKTIYETKRIGYSTRIVKDGSLAKGIKKTRTKGVAGIRTLTYRVTYTDGVQTGRALVKSVVTRTPVTKVVAVGTKAAAPSSTCDSNYSGCVPIASDVDCAGGSGNGPAYVSGPVRIIGTDIYDLDRDGDGVACDT